MRPPVSEIEPSSAPVLIGTRWVSASASPTVLPAGAASCGVPAVVAGRAVAGAVAVPSGCAVWRRRRRRLRLLRREQEEPGQDHEEAERSREDQILALVVHRATPVDLG